MPITCEASGVWDAIADAPFLSKQQWQAANLLILCQIIVANGGNPDMSTCTVAGLWDAIKGTPPFISDQQFYSENLNLLCQLAEGGGTGGGLEFTAGHGSPEGATVGSPGDTFWDLDTDFEYTKVTGTATNTGWKVH